MRVGSSVALAARGDWATAGLATATGEAATAAALVVRPGLSDGGAVGRTVGVSLASARWGWARANRGAGLAAGTSVGWGWLISAGAWLFVCRVTVELEARNGLDDDRLGDSIGCGAATTAAAPGCDVVRVWRCGTGTGVRAIRGDDSAVCSLRVACGVMAAVGDTATSTCSSDCAALVVVCFWAAVFTGLS